MFSVGDKIFCITSEGAASLHLGDIDTVAAVRMVGTVEEIQLKSHGSYTPAWRWYKYEYIKDGSFNCGSCGWKATRAVTYNGVHECISCFMTHMAVCHDCHTFKPVRELKTDNSGHTWCPTCFDKRFFTCCRCARSRATDIRVSASMLAEVPPTLITAQERPTDWCVNCFQQQFLRCRRCQTWLRPDTARMVGSRPGHYCSTCAEIGIGIHSYNHKPEPMWRRLDKDKDPLHFGFELEVENHDLSGEQLEARAAKLNQLKYVYCKHDGSVCNGFEIVSHPATWGWLKKNREFIEDNILSIRSEGFISYDARMCGLHIHASKKPIGPTNILKLQKLIYEDPQFTLYVSRRTKEQLEQYASTGANPDARVVKASMMGTGYRGIRGALNLGPAHTVEYRLFRGTLRPESFWRAFEFVRGSIMYCKDESLEKVGVLRFAKWIADHKAEYPRLHAFLDAEKPDDNEKVPVLKKEKPVSESPDSPAMTPVEVPVTVRPNGVLWPEWVLSGPDDPVPDDGINR